MKLSIIVPVYNMADGKLQYCLNSLLAQRMEDYEIIPVDDASTDNSADVLKDFARKYPTIIHPVYSKENHRQGGAKNRGLAKANGTWVGFIDSDDWIHPDMYPDLLRKAEETGADLVGCDYSLVTEETLTPGKAIINNDDNQCGVLDKEKHKAHILKSGSMVVKIYKRQVLIENNLCFPEDIFYEDNYAAPFWSLYFKHFERVNQPYYYYRTVADSTTHHVSFAKCMDRMTAAKKLLLECREKGFYESYKDEIDFRFTQLFYITTLYSYMLAGEKRKLRDTKYLQREMKKYLSEFQNNPYYIERVSAEEKKMLALHQKNNFLFFVYFRLLFGYRNLRKKK